MKCVDCLDFPALSSSEPSIIRLATVAIILTFCCNAMRIGCCSSTSWIRLWVHGSSIRYLELVKRNGWKLALVSASRIDVERDVCQSPSFICPTQAGHPPHFLWQDVQAIVGGSTHHLANEFCEYLECLGLGKFSWAGFGNPFINEDAANALRALYNAIRPICCGPGVRCLASTNSLIYQVRKRFLPVHLINVGPIESVAQAIPSIRGPVMGLWVWVRRAAGQHERVFRNLNAIVPCSAVQIVVEDHMNPLGVPYDPCVYCERSYYAPLDQILCGSIADSQERLVTFVRAAVDHLREETTAIRSVPNDALQRRRRVNGRSRRG